MSQAIWAILFEFRCAAEVVVSADFYIPVFMFTLIVTFMSARIR